MKIACIQLSSGENYQSNFKDILKYVNQAIKNKSDLIIIAGRPSMGKTALGTNIAFNCDK